MPRPLTAGDRVRVLSHPDFSDLAGTLVTVVNPHYFDFVNAETTRYGTTFFYRRELSDPIDMTCPVARRKYNIKEPTRWEKIKTKIVKLFRGR